VPNPDRERLRKQDKDLIIREKEVIMERTLSIVKPDGVKQNLIGEVIKCFESNRLHVVGLKMIRMEKREAEGFYVVHRGKPFFESLTSFMSSGPSVVMVLEGQNVISRTRELMGATDPQKAKEGTLRREYATSIEQNIVHGSDAPETAAFEIGYFFSGMESL
jgi:nucleoside-diphosphate kinase